MNRIVLNSIFALIVILVFSAFYYLIRESPSRAAQKKEPLRTSSPQSILGDRGSTSESEFLEAGMNGSDDQANELADSQSFLNEVGVSGPSLITLFETTQDLKWLRRAQKEFPNDLQVVIASALCEEGDRGKWIDKWKELEPENGLPLYLKANALMEEEKPEEADEILKQSLQHEWTSYSNDRVDGRVDFLLATDNYDHKAYLKLMDSPLEAGFGDVTGNQIERLMQELMGDDDPVARSEVTVWLSLNTLGT